MSKLSRLPIQGRRACEALARSTHWSAESWAAAVDRLDRAGLFPSVGLTQVFEVSSKVGVKPIDAAASLIVAARERASQEIQLELERDPTLDLDALRQRFPSLTLEVVDSPAARAEKALVCHARTEGRLETGAHEHDCGRLEDHDFEHRCGVKISGGVCGAAW